MSTINSIKELGQVKENYDKSVNAHFYCVCGV